MQKDGNVFARNISFVKKYKHISDSHDHSDIGSSGSAEMNTENRHQDNRGSNTYNVENVRRKSNILRYDVHETHRFDLVKHNHIEKNMKVYAKEFEWTLFFDFVYTLNYVVYMILDNAFLEN